MKTVIIVQARMTSTRLPGKVLKEVMGKPLLEYQIERLRRVRLADEIVIATTVNTTDEPLVDFCNRMSLPFYRGSEEDVLERYFKASISCGADIVVRVTSDCPLIDPEVCDKAIELFLKSQPSCDYVSISGYPRGLNTEVFSFDVLRECFLEAKELPAREHVTPFIYQHPERYRLMELTCDNDHSHHRWTVDTPEDLLLVSKLLEELYPQNPYFRMEDVIELLSRHKDWIDINAKVQQKKYGE